MRDTSSIAPEVSPVSPNNNNILKDEDSYVNIDTDSVDDSCGKDGPIVEMVPSGQALIGAVTDAIKQMKTEVLEQDQAWGPEKKMMSLELLLNGADAESDDALDKDCRSPGDESRSSQSDGERVVPVDCETITPPSTPYSSQAARPPCAICRNENGRCHASDPGSMQTFFATTLSFEGILSSADWLCMKCYSKWYNRCKRKATSVVTALTVVDGGVQAVPSGNSTPVATPPRRKRAREPKDKDSKRKVRKNRKQAGPVQPIEPQPEPEPELLDHDTDSDDALLLTRMTLSNYAHNYPHHNLSNSYNGTNSADTRSNICTGRDLEMEVDELHTELHRARGEMMRLAQELARRDEQMEGMIKFVKTEMASMHGLLAEIADMRWRPGTPAPPVVPTHNHHVQMVPSSSGPTGHIFHLNGKILDNNPTVSTADKHSCMMPRMNHQHVKPPGDVAV